MGDLARLGRRIFVECRGGEDCTLGNRAELDPASFPADLPWEDLAKQRTFRCKRCGGTKVEVRLEVEREWKRRLRR